MNYIEALLTKKTEPVFKNFNSVENMVKTMFPQLQESVAPKQEVLAEKNNDVIDSIKRHAENVLTTPKEKLEIDKINEEITEDLKSAFLNESVTTQEISRANFYKLYRDKDETFECKISVEGTSLNNSSVRLVLESEEWNIFFNGKIYRDGRCVVPMKKMTIFSEGTVGKAKLEVMIDDSVFVPWEEAFVVEGAKKVKVEVLKNQKVSGLTGGVPGRFIILVNNSTKNQTFNQESVSSSASNRFVLGISNKTIGLNSAATFIYVSDLTVGGATGQSRWILSATT